MPLPISLRRSLAGAFVAAAALTLSAHSAAAQKTRVASSNRDEQAIASYHITEAGVRKYYKTMDNLFTLAEKNPGLRNALDSDDKDQTISAMAARYDRVPAIKNAITSAGFTSTEFATFTMAFLQAGMTASLMDEGDPKMRVKEVPPGVSKENVDFVRTHKPLIEQLDKELKAHHPNASQGDAGAH